jgi:hypothetical protein
MRYYEIQISPSSLSTSSFAPITFSTLTPLKTDNGSALSVDIDIFQTWYHQPAQNGYIKIKGVDFKDLNQSANFNLARIKVSVGMSKGLPYAQPNQAGLIIDGTILQCFGNWLGSEVSLDFVIGAATYNPKTDVNLSFNWKKGDTLQSAVTNSLKKAYPNIPVNGSFSSNLVYTEDQWGQYTNLLSFSKQMNHYSKQIITSEGYLGASITNTPSGFLLFDGTSPSPKTTKVNFTDIVGNLTWIDIATIQAKLIMRSDLNVGDNIVFPKGSPVLNIVNNFSQYRNNISFNGTFQINQVRHVGSSRQADGNSWCTIVNALIPGVLK